MNICAQDRAADSLPAKQASGHASEEMWHYILMRPSKMSRHIIQSPRKL